MVSGTPALSSAEVQHTVAADTRLRVILPGIGRLCRSVGCRAGNGSWGPTHGLQASQPSGTGAELTHAGCRTRWRPDCTPGNRAEV